MHTKAIVCSVLLLAVAITVDSSFIICEFHSGYISCPAGTVINVIKATYGRNVGGSVCPHSSIRTTSCSSSSSFNKVKNACNGKSLCKVTASNSVFGDPCQHTYKYLELDYDCITVSLG